MALGLPEHPPEDLEFTDSLDDETCPECGWDSSDIRLDLHSAHEQRILIAVEKADGSPFSSLGSAEALCLYFKCPSCDALFTTEEETMLGGMA